MSWAKQYAALVQELRTSKQIRSIASKPNRGAPAKTIAAVAKQHGVATAQLAPWGAHDGLVLAWEAKTGECGRIEIPALRQVFGDWSEVIYFDDTPAKSKLRRLRPIDFFGFGNSACAALLDGQVYLHEVGEPTIVPLGVDLEGYFALLPKTRGLVGWHDAIAADRNRKITTTAAATKFITRAPVLFPGLELARLLPKTKLPKAPPVDDFATLAAALTAAGVKYRVPKQRPRDAWHSCDHLLYLKTGAVNLRKAEEVLVRVVSPNWANAAKDVLKFNLVKGTLEVRAE